jgi:acyl carrier protein
MGLDFVSMVMEIQSEFGIEFDCDAKRSQTVGGLFDCIRDRMANAADGSTGQYAGPLWERYLDVVERELAIDRTRLVPNASFVGDLGVS